MSICAIWIVSLESRSRNNKSLIFSRQYPVVFKKAKQAGSLPKSQFPSDEEIASGILDELQVFRTSNEFVENFDSCLKQRQSPMYSILNETIWPIVAITKNGIIFACLPLVDAPINGIKKLKCNEIGSVTIAYSLLQNIAEILCSNPMESITDENLQDLQDYLFICMPFGTPREMDPATVRGILSAKVSMLTPKQKVPAWRPVAYKGRQNIQLFIKENVRCIQYGRPEVPDVCEVYGTISCKTELEGVPEVVFDLISTSKPQVLENCVFHPCVQLSDATRMAVDDDEKSANNYGVRSIRFCPPLESFTLCHYKASVAAPPILAYYQMTDDVDFAHIKIQLNLWKTMKTSFENLRVSIPFLNRKPIRRVESAQTSPNLSVFDKNTIVWNLGSKFPSKTLQASVEAKVYFFTSDDKIAKYDQFCTGLNAYIQISFKAVDFAYSDIKIGSRSICIYPSSKVKSSIEAEFVSAEYIIWNSLGEVLGGS